MDSVRDPCDVELESLRAENVQLLKALEDIIADLAIRAKIAGDDRLDVSDGVLRRALETIAKAKGKRVP